MGGRAGASGGFARLSHESWRGFFKEDLLRVASYSARVLRLVELLRSRSRSLSAAKIVMGVIGRDTVGYSRDIQECFSALLGVDCVNCEEAVSKVAMGVPLQQVAPSVELRFRGGGILDALMTLERLARESIRSSVGVDLDEERLAAAVERDFNSLVGNPLKVFSLLRGLLTSLRRVLPHHNPHSFFAYSLRSVPRFALERLAGSNYVELAGRFGVALEELLPLESEDHSVLTHRPGSTGDLLVSVVDLSFRLHDVVRSYRLRRLRARDERLSQLELVGPLVTAVAETLGVRSQAEVVARSLLSEGHTVERRGEYRLVRLRVRAGSPARYLTFGGKQMPAERFIEGLSPYLVLGLARFEGVNKEGAEITANLLVYLRAR